MFYLCSFLDAIWHRSHFALRTGAEGVRHADNLAGSGRVDATRLSPVGNGEH
jgi:hypothetical protein